MPKSDSRPDLLRVSGSHSAPQYVKPGYNRHVLSNAVVDPSGRFRVPGLKRVFAQKPKKRRPKTDQNRPIGVKKMKLAKMPIGVDLAGFSRVLTCFGEVVRKWRVGQVGVRNSGFLPFLKFWYQRAGGSRRTRKWTCGMARACQKWPERALWVGQRRVEAV